MSNVYQFRVVRPTFNRDHGNQTNARGIVLVLGNARFKR